MTPPKRRDNHQATQDFIAYYAGELDSTGDDFYSANIDIVHHQIHVGNHYIKTVAGTINAGTAVALAIAIRPAIGTVIHLSGELTADKAGYWELYENPDISVYGSTFVPFNSNRNSTDMSAGTYNSTLTIASLGTLIQGPRYIGASAPSSKVGGGDSTRHEWMLNPGYEYLWWYVADGATTKVSAELQFYEVDA